MKKITVCLTLAFCLLFCACGKGADGAAAPANQTLYEYGLDVIALMDEMVRSDAYGALLSASDGIDAVAAAIAEGDYTAPKAAYRVTLPSDLLGQVLAIVTTAEPPALSQALRDNLQHRLLASLANQVNGRSGAATIAASSIYTGNKVFVSDELTADTLYLYTYETGFPVLIAFTMGEGGAVSATGCYILNEDYPCATADDVEVLLSACHLSGCTAERADD